MNSETLTYFQYIARYKNITKAAKHFYISQSTLSRQLIALEEELGVTLFIRDNKKLELTKSGSVFYDECDSLIKHMDVIVKKIQLIDNGTSGVLKIVTPGNFKDIIPESLNTFKKNFPDTQLIVESYNFNELPSGILYDIYDVGFTYEFATSYNEELESITIGEEHFSIVVSSQLIKDPTKEDIITIMKTLPLILPAYVEPPFIKLVLYELQSFAKVRGKEPIYVNTTESAMLQVSLGLGYSIVPTSLNRFRTIDNLVTYLPLDDFSAKSKIIMLYKKSNPSNLLTSLVSIVKNISESNTNI